jgi:hypothetical protein
MRCPGSASTITEVLEPGDALSPLPAAVTKKKERLGHPNALNCDVGHFLEWWFL